MLFPFFPSAKGPTLTVSSYTTFPSSLGMPAAEYRQQNGWANRKEISWTNRKEISWPETQKTAKRFRFSLPFWG
jgi:hypothetical protein